MVVRDGVVQVAAGGRAAAAGGRAGGGAGDDEVLQPPGRFVTELFSAVVAAAAGQRGEGDGEIAGAGRSAGRPGLSWWPVAGAAAVRAAVAGAAVAGAAVAGAAVAGAASPGLLGWLRKRRARRAGMRPCAMAWPVWVMVRLQLVLG